MTVEMIQQNMDTFLDLLNHYNELIQTKMKTDDKKKLIKIDEDLEKTMIYLLKLIEKVKNLIKEERENVKA